MRHALGIAFVVALFVSDMIAQNQPVAFEVATIKVSTDADRVIGMFTYPGGRLVATRYTLKMLIHEAYAIEDFRILSGPLWTSTDVYNIEARPSASSALSTWIPSSFKTPPNEEMRGMLQTLLADRFQLRLHRESRNETVYVLLTGKGGVKLKPPKSTTDQPFVSYLQNGLRGQNATMDQLVERLEGLLGRPVLNKTNIKGNYDFLMEYPPDDAATDRTVLLLRMLEEQLGLKLDTQKDLVDVIVIDHAEKPDAN